MQQNIFLVPHIWLHFHFICGTLCKPTFQKSTYFDSLELINFSLSLDFHASLPSIKWHRTRLGTPIGNFGELFGLVFHNLIEDPFIGL